MPGSHADPALSASAAAAAGAAPELKLLAEALMPGNRSSQASTAWGSQDVSDCGPQSPISSRLSTPGSPTTSHNTARSVSGDAAADPWPKSSLAKALPQPPLPTELVALSSPLSTVSSPARAADKRGPPVPSNLSPSVAQPGYGLFSGLEAPLGSGTGSIWESPVVSLAVAEWPCGGVSFGGDEAPAASAALPASTLSTAQPAEAAAGDSAAPALPDSLFSDPWPGMDRPEINPWSLGASSLLSEAPAAPASTGIAGDIAAAAWRMSMLNPSASEFNAPAAATVAAPAAALQPRHSGPDALHLQSSKPAPEPGLLGEARGSGSIWAAPPGFGVPAAASSGVSGSWGSTGHALWSGGGTAVSQTASLAGWDDGSSQPFADAPGFLDSLMQQVLPEDEVHRGSAMHHQQQEQQPSAFLYLQGNPDAQLQQPRQPGFAGAFGRDASAAARLPVSGSTGLQLGSLFTLPPLSQPWALGAGDAFAAAQAQHQGMQGLAPGPAAFLPGGGFQQQALAPTLPGPGMSRAARGGGPQPLDGPAARPLLPAMPGQGSHLLSADKGFAVHAVRPSDVVHAFAQVRSCLSIHAACQTLGSHATCQAAQCRAGS
jgi:hypothetical protein